MKNNIIPVMTCFNDNYSIPAGVCFYSLLKNSNKNFTYKIYVLQTDISEYNKNKLHEIVSNFDNGTLEFINMNNKYEDLFKKTTIKHHYSKEMYYKFNAPSVFPQYEKIIITDVDVLFINDLSSDFINFKTEEDYYLSACKTIYKGNAQLNKIFADAREGKFSEEEKKLLGYAGGYYFYNLRKLREDNIEAKLNDFAQKNSDRIFLPEQDTINLVCGKKIKPMPPNSLVCNYAYDMFKTEEDYKCDKNWDPEEVKFALEKPIQLHFAGGIKPWQNPNIAKSEVWYDYLKETPYYMDVIRNFTIKPKSKRLFQIKYKKNIIKLEKITL